MLFSNKPPQLSTPLAGFKRLEHHLSHRTTLIGTCTRPLREFIFLKLHAFVFIHFSSAESCLRENFTFLGHAHRAIYQHHKLIVFVAITVHLVDAVFISTCIRPTIVDGPAHLSPLTTPVWKSEMQPQQLSCGPQLWSSTTESFVHTHTPTHDGKSVCCITTVCRFV